MSEQKAFNLRIDEQEIAWLAIDVPGEKMNTLQAAFAEEMEQVFGSCREAVGGSIFKAPADSQDLI